MIKSASKLVLLAMTLTLCVALFMKLVEAKDFMMALTAVFGYYFAKNGRSDITSAS